MNKQFTFLSILLSALTLPLLVHAEIYKMVDAEGRVTYSNVKIKGAKKLQLEPADTNFGNEPTGEKKRTPSTRTATPASFPKVDSGTQNQRDGKRKEILQAELDAEKAALEEAKKAYAEGESNPEVYQQKNADGTSKTFRNVAKFQEKMKGLQEEVDAHQRNIDLLTKEINAIN
jgi:outer membrane protein TolC